MARFYGLLAFAAAVTALVPAGLTQNVSAPESLPAAEQTITISLAKPFHSRSDWGLVATHGPITKDYGDNDAPGSLTLCLQKSLRPPCVSEPVTLPLRPTSSGSPAWEPHYLLKTEIVYPRGPKSAPFLLIGTGSLNSGDGDQIVCTQLVAYDAGSDSFHRVFGQCTGHNNNQEVRFVKDGPLRGSVISAEPQSHAPYGFWIVVNELDSAGKYHVALRYPSATRYNDGNQLGVIDSEMPNIQQRLGIWKSGEPLPLPPDTPCKSPELRHTELWCNGAHRSP